MTSTTYAAIPLVSTPEIISTENLEPPPLIPATSYTANTQQRPVRLSVPDARSLYNTSSVHHSTFQEPLPSMSASVGGYHAIQQFATSRLPKHFLR